MKILKKLMVMIISLVMMIVLALCLIPKFEHVNKDFILESAKWMSSVDDSKLLSEINIPGSHDSATEHVELAFFSRCQDLSISEQLNAGIRYLDIRLGMEEGRMKLMHGFTSAKKGNIFSEDLFLEDVLKDCYQFLDDHPSETIIFMVKQEYGDDSIDEFQHLLHEIIQKNQSYWYLNDEIPLLKQVRGKLVFMRRYPDAAGLNERSGIHMEWHEPGGYDGIAYESFAKHDCLVQDMYELEVNEKWKVYNYALKKEFNGVSIHFLSTKGSLTYGHPYYYAYHLNQRFLDQTLENKTYGWIIFDFVNAEIAQHVYQTNFRKE